jgi:hypothetical protein
MPIRDLISKRIQCVHLVYLVPCKTIGDEHTSLLLHPSSPDGRDVRINTRSPRQSTVTSRSALLFVASEYAVSLPRLGETYLSMLQPFNHSERALVLKVSTAV